MLIQPKLKHSLLINKRQKCFLNLNRFVLETDSAWSASAGGVTPEEGKDYLLGKVFDASGVTCELITDASITEGTASVTTCTDATNGYSAEAMGAWSIANGDASHIAITYTASGGAFQEGGADADVSGIALFDGGTLILAGVQGTTFNVADGETCDVDMSSAS